jgi:hypothetical protein
MARAFRRLVLQPLQTFSMLSRWQPSKPDRATVTDHSEIFSLAVYKLFGAHSVAEAEV